MVIFDRFNDYRFYIWTLFPHTGSISAKSLLIRFQTNKYLAIKGYNTGF